MPDKDIKIKYDGNDKLYFYQDNELVFSTKFFRGQKLELDLSVEFAYWNTTNKIEQTRLEKYNQERKEIIAEVRELYTPEQNKSKSDDDIWTDYLNRNN